MEFRDNSWANLVFVSTLDRRRSRKEIAEAWDIPKTKLYKGRVDREIDRLEQVKILDIDENGILADLKSMPFRTEIENYFKTRGKKDSSDFADKLVENIDDFSSVLTNEDLRKNLLDIELVKDFYNSDPREAKDRPVELFYFLGGELFVGLDGKRFDTEHSPKVFSRASGRIADEIQGLQTAREY